MQYEADRAKDKGGEPSLAEMTTKAIDILSKNEDGFVLMVEAGRIDHAHHAGNAARALADTVAAAAAVQGRLREGQPGRDADHRDRRPQPHVDHHRLSEAQQSDPRHRRHRRRQEALHDAWLHERPRRQARRAARRPDQCRHHRTRTSCSRRWCRSAKAKRMPATTWRSSRQGPWAHLFQRRGRSRT